MKPLRRLLLFAAAVAFAVSGCFQLKAEPIPLLPGPVTQEEIEENRSPKLSWLRFLNIAENGPIVPGLRQGLVPQGLDYLPEEDWLIISGYRDNDTSLVVVVHGESGELVKAVSFRLPGGGAYRGHAGGVAVSDRHLWLASGSQVYWVRLDKFIAARDGTEITFDGTARIDARASFVSVTDGVLWVGDFAYEAEGYETAGHHKLRNRQGRQHHGWIAGYKLDPATDLIPASRPKANGVYIPDYVLSIPDKIQGSYILGDYIILTESYGRRNDSHLFIYENPLDEPAHRTVWIAGTEVSVWFLDDGNRVDSWVLPPMVESVVERDGRIYIMFESAALKYLPNGRYALSRLQIVDTADLLP